MPVYLREASGDKKRIYALSFSPDGFSITRTTDGLTFEVSEPATRLFSFLLAAQAEQLAPNEQLRFLNCRVRKDGAEGMGTLLVRPTPTIERMVRPRGRYPDRAPEMKLKVVGSSSMAETSVQPEGIPFRHQVAIMELHVLSGFAATSSALAVHFQDVSEMYSLLGGLPSPEFAIVGGTVVIENADGLNIRIGGSEKAELSEKERIEFLVLLKRWLSGGYGRRLGVRAFLANEFRSGTGLVFEAPSQRGRERRIPFHLARLSVHGIEERLAYRDVAELFSVLYLCRGKETVEPIRVTESEEKTETEEKAEKAETKDTSETLREGDK